MKRRLMLAAMSLILTVTLSVTSMNTVAEASPKMSPTEENLEITINSFLESDGAVAEELTDEMLKTFLETPLDFLRVIDTYPLDKQELLLSRIANVAVGMPDEERLSFEDIIYSADETTPGISLLETYYSEALEATPPQNSVSNLPKYDMESVNQIVKAYLASDSEGNEAFYNYAAEHSTMLRNACFGTGNSVNVMAGPLECSNGSVSSNSPWFRSFPTLSPHICPWAD